jgi:hypothetical protein
MKSSKTDPHNISVKELIDERISLRERQLFSEIERDIESQRSRALDNLQRRVSDFAGVNATTTSDVETVFNSYEERVLKALEALGDLEQRIAVIYASNSADDTSSQSGLGIKANEKLSEFKRDLQLFVSAYRRDVESRVSKSEEDTGVVLTQQFRQQVESALSEMLHELSISQSTKEPSWITPLSFNSLPETFHRVGSTHVETSALGDQIDSLKAAIGRLSASNLRTLSEAELTKKEEEYLGLVSSLSQKITDIESSRQAYDEGDLVILKQALIIGLEGNPMLASQILDGIEAFMKTSPREATSMSKFIEHFFRKSQRNRFR